MHQEKMQEAYMTICPQEDLSIPIFEDYHFYFCLPVLLFILVVMNIKSFIQISKVYPVSAT